MKKTQTDLLQGTLDLLVLKTLQPGPAHGWDIAQRIQQISQNVLRVRQNITNLKAVGRKQLSAETETWRRFTGAVELTLKTP